MVFGCLFVGQELYYGGQRGCFVTYSAGSAAADFTAVFAPYSAAAAAAAARNCDPAPASAAAAAAAEWPTCRLRGAMVDCLLLYCPCRVAQPVDFLQASPRPIPHISVRVFGTHHDTFLSCMFTRTWTSPSAGEWQNGCMHGVGTFDGPDGTKY